MKLTPLDIRKQEFAKRVRGVDEEEVQAFLQMVASQWEEIQEGHRHLEDKVRDLEGKLDHYRRVEEALQEALRTARENAKEVVETARKKAQVMLDEAEVMATDVKRDAEEERRKMRRQVARLTQRRDEIVSRLRAFLISEMEILARFEGDDAIGFIKLLPADARAAQGQEPMAVHAATDTGASRKSSRPAQLEDEPVAADEPEPEPVPLPPWAEFEEDDELPSPFEDVPAEATVDQTEEGDLTSPDEFETASRSALQSGPEREAEAEPEPNAEPVLHDEARLIEDDSVGAPGPEVDRRGEGPTIDDQRPLVMTGERREDQAGEARQDSFRTPEDEDLPVTTPSPVTAAVANWFNEHVRSPIRRFTEGQEEDKSATPAAGGGAAQERRGDGADAFPEGGGTLPYEEKHQDAPDEDAEKFTVSSEEVERIRRILKGLD